MSVSEAMQIWCRQVFLLDLTPTRRWSYLCLAGSLLVTLASHQFIGPVKVSIFMDVVGTETEPLAKSLVMLVLVPCLVSYSILVSLVKSPGALVVIVCTFYGALYGFITVVHMLSGGHPGAWLAWVLYYATETKCVIVMPMIWSVIADISTPDLAKKAYPVMFFVVQLGGILGSLVAIQVSDLGGELGLLLMQAASFVLIAGLAVVGCRLVDESASDDAGTALAPAAAIVAAEGAVAAAASAAASTAAEARGVRGGGAAAVEKVSAGFGGLWRDGFEGLWLLLSRPYVFMAFWVSYATLMPRTVLDYQNSILGVTMYDTREDQIAFFGKVNMMINCGTAVLTLLGTGPIVQSIGIGYSLLILPICMMLCIGALCLHYSLGMSTAALVLVCIIAYGLNSPCKEMLYVRTSREIKYKAKSWSEMYGSQWMKLFGAQMNLWVNREGAFCTPHCFHSGTTAGVTGAWVVLWFGIAWRLGVQHRQLEKDDAIVE